MMNRFAARTGMTVGEFAMTITIAIPAAVIAVAILGGLLENYLQSTVPGY